MAKIRSNTNNRYRRIRTRSRNIISTIINTSTRLIGNPMFLIAIAVSLYLNSNQTLIKTFTDKFANSQLLSPITNYIGNHTQQTVGFILAGTTSLTVLPPSFSFAAFILLGFVCYLAPAADYVEYFALTAFSLLFIRIRNIRARIILIVLIVLTLALGWWGKKLFSL